MPGDKRHAQAHTMRSSGHVPVEAIWDGQMTGLFATIHSSIALLNTQHHGLVFKTVFRISENSIEQFIPKGSTMNDQI